MEKPRQCAYDDCQGGRIWYHGWYERKEGNIPCGECGVSDRLPIRRFLCCDCGRTFSKRPAFLVFGHSLAAIAYQQVVEALEASERAEKPAAPAEEPATTNESTVPTLEPVTQVQKPLLKERDWWQPGLAAVQAFRTRLRQAATALTARLEKHLHVALSGGANVLDLLHLAADIARSQSTSEEVPRLACHVLFLALAHTRSNAPYALTAT